MRLECVLACWKLHNITINMNDIVNVIFRRRRINVCVCVIQLHCARLTHKFTAQSNYARDVFWIRMVHRNTILHTSTTYNVVWTYTHWQTNICISIYIKGAGGLFPKQRDGDVLHHRIRNGWKAYNFCIYVLRADGSNGWTLYLTSGKPAGGFVRFTKHKFILVGRLVDAETIRMSLLLCQPTTQRGNTRRRTHITTMCENGRHNPLFSDQMHHLP